METEETQAGAGPGVGEQLRQAREAMGRSRADLAEELRLTEDQIQALEEEAFSRLPAEAYVRGYLRNFAASVGLLPDAVIEAYERHGEEGDAAANPEDETPLIPVPEKPLIEHPWRVVWISLALVAVVSAATVWFLGQDEQGLPAAGEATESAPAETSEKSPEAAAKGPASPAEGTTPEPGAEAPASDSDSEADGLVDGEPVAADEAEAGESDASAEGPAPAAAEETSNEASDEAAKETAEADTPGLIADDREVRQVAANRQLLRVRAWADSWMQVTDNRGNVLLRRLVSADEDLRLYGEAPFAVKAGNAAGVQLYFEGEPLAPLGGPGEVVRLNVDADSETIPVADVAPPPQPAPEPKPETEPEAEPTEPAPQSGDDSGEETTESESKPAEANAEQATDSETADSETAGSSASPGGQSATEAEAGPAEAESSAPQSGESPGETATASP